MLERRPLKRRSLFFVLWLFTYLVFMAGATVYVFVLFATRPNAPNSLLLLGIGCCYVVNVLSGLAVWHWWKWGFFVLAGSIMVTVALTVIEATISVWWIASLIAGYIVILIARPSWYYFE
ncbi:MAG: hypothetical protein RBU23_03410 [Candidatus Auribacterota bacterium]|jgi:hypothetical protein|nr:hypothetical protein [Candidatus Auribacterota bacterium]